MPVPSSARDPAPRSVPRAAHRAAGLALALLLAPALVALAPAHAAPSAPSAGAEAAAERASAAPRGNAAPAPPAAPRAADSAPRAALLAAAPASPAATAVAGGVAPTYRTRIPPAARVSYRLTRGAIVGSGEIDWQPQGDAYTLRLEGRVPLLGTLIVQTSRGGFDAAGLAPLRYTDKRLRRPERSADFDHGAGSVSFSGGNTAPLAPGLQDRLSVMLQLAAIANAWSRPPAPGTELRIPVIGLRGDAAVWSLRFEGPQAVATPDGTVNALRFLREADKPHDTRAEFWLDPARSYMPVRARLTDGNGDALELLRAPPTQ